LKSLEQFDVTVTAVKPDVILKQVVEAGKPYLRAVQLFKVNKDLTKQAGDTIKIPKRPRLTASQFTAGSENVPSTSVTYSTVSITANTVGQSVKIPLTAIKNAQVDVVNDLVNALGEAIALKEDEDCVNALISGASFVISATSAGVLTYEDLIKAKSSLEGAYFTPKVLLVNPSEHNDLLKSDMFTDASKYGSAEPLLNGEVGKIAGMKVVVDHKVPSGKAIVLDPDYAGLYVLKEDVKVEEKELPEQYAVQLIATKWYGVGVIYSSAIAVISAC